MCLTYIIVEEKHLDHLGDRVGFPTGICAICHVTGCHVTGYA